MRQTTRRRSLLPVGVFLGTILPLATALPAEGAPQDEQDSEHYIVRVVGRDPVVVRTGPHGEHVEPRCFFLGTDHRRGVLGVELLRLTSELRHHFGAPEDAGVMVAKVLEDSPAAAAGIRVGDVLTAIDTEKISAPVEVTRLVRPKQEGERLQLEVWREGRPRTLEVTIAERDGVAVDLGGALLEHCKEFDIDVDMEAIRTALEGARQHFQNPEWLSRWRRLEAVEVEHMEERVRELEERLEELERQLEHKGGSEGRRNEG